MKLLFDANLSPRLVGRLGELFPGSEHVFSTGLERVAPDMKIRDYAAISGFTIVTADADFARLAETLGTPPYVVRIENCAFRTAAVESLLRRNAVRIAQIDQLASGILRLRWNE